MRSDLGASGLPQGSRQAEAKTRRKLRLPPCSAMLAEPKEQRFRPVQL